MWIRSQDKTILMDVKAFKLEVMNVVQKNGEGKVYAIVWNGWQCFYERSLGEYSTEEKALAVLDLIQKYIGGKSQYYITRDIGNPNGNHVLNDIYIPLGYCKNGIFQMPQDNEL